LPKTGAMTVSSNIAAPLLPWRDHFRATLVLGLPIIGSLLAQMAIGLTDTIMVGWYGVTELAAMVLASSMFFIFFIVGSGFAMAVMPVVASAAGEEDHRQVRRVTRMGIWISLIYCTAAMPVLWNFKALMLLIGQKPEIAAIGQDYMRVAQWGMFPAMLVMAVKSFLSGIERPGWVLWATIVGGLANAVMNYALIFGHWGAPEMGVRGAAVASVTTATLTFLVLAVYSGRARGVRDYEIFVRIWRSDWPALFELFRLGWPIGATMLAEVGLFSASAVMMGWIGTRELATHGIAIQIASISFMIYLGLANVATIRVGRALGRRDPGGIWRAGATSAGLQLGFAALAAGLFLLKPAFLIGLFLNTENPDSAGIIAYGTGLLAVAAVFQVVDGMQAVVLGVLRGLKDTRVPMICAVFSYWIVGMPVGYVLGFKLGFGGYGIWAGLVTGLALAAVTLLWRYRIIARRMKFA